ncbi:UNVERIFIED_CONTAM: hypothetical protein PYX00_006458 [Menopon gallinae]|uniref:Cell division control protein n=1 Tax=Menopon gallinae TaxID=328185 RepID=A0AAW2HWA4_9NEOP
MKSAVRQTKIPFTERKLRPRTKCVTPKKVHSSDEENSPLKYKLVVSSESKIILRRSSTCSPTKKSTPKRGAKKAEKEDEDCPTPSKRKYVKTNESTPEKNISTPSTMLGRLQLSSTKKSTNNTSPNVKKGFTPKQLFSSTNGSASSARKALYSSSNTLPGREEEVNRLFSLLEKHLEEQSCGSIYIAGLPGTGKTASIEHVIQSEKIKKGYNIVKINCTSFSSSVSIYKRICTELKVKTAGKVDKDPLVLIEKYLLRKHKMILLILDEIDQLETRTQSVLYKIFEWPSWSKARLVLIGIANAVDLTDRILPRLCAKVELKPTLLHFSPYSKDQIKEILSHRLAEAGADNIFTPSAIELISAKVAGMSGDVRRALDLGRRVVEISEEAKGAKAESADKSLAKKIDPKAINASVLTDFLKMNDCRRSPRKLNTTPVKISGSESKHGNENSGRAPFLSPKHLFADEGEGEDGVLREIDPNRSVQNWSPGKVASGRRESPRKHPSRGQNEFSVDSKDVLSVVKNIYGSSKSLKSVGEDSSFPLHQKILICTFLLISKKGKAKDLNVGKLHQVYTKICTKRGITPVDLSGFLFLCRQVEMTGIMQIGKGPGKLAKVSLQWDEAEVTDALKDLNLLSSILDDVSCL